ncbi:hypothetical protein RND81_06G033400 [Saponaria officinalis]|uniref:Remorin C-terminal domain-containing protein n=1 Tax=Saponaria officinalis TaxID=3572 RepID=A0AAW1K6W2_SAPOF
MERKLGKKVLMTSNTFSGTFQSPESSLCSEDDRANTGNSKGWYSERVPQSGYRARKGYVAASALMPFSSGRALPSKWDDAERWISSPLSVGDCGSHLAQRRAKSKSGPLGPTGVGLCGGYNSFSPVFGVGVIGGGKWRNSIAGESTAAVGVVGGSGGGGGDGRRRSCPGHGEPEWLDLWGGPLSLTDKRDVNMDNDGFESNLAHDHFDSINSSSNNDDDNNNNACIDESKVDRVISRRDMATQMYPESESSSPISAYSPSPLLENEPNYMNNQSPEFEVRDVQIDRQSSKTTQNLKANEVPHNFSTFVDEDTKMFKLQRKEARIKAWENLQKAKAESAIQKLEMKLEKKRATSMEKIVEKLRRAEIKAQKMKGSLGNDNDNVQSRSLLKTTSKIPSFCKKFQSRAFPKSCSTCYPF